MSLLKLLGMNLTRAFKVDKQVLFGGTVLIGG